jgi:uncharacterized membrane protein YhaH (DUF805 family)
MNDHSSAAAGLIAGAIFAYGIVVLALIAFTIWVYWRIFAKAGFNGALSLLNFVPGVGQLICMLILAFGRWPIEDQLAALQARGSFGPTVPPAPPGTSVMPS